MKLCLLLFLLVLMTSCVSASKEVCGFYWVSGDDSTPYATVSANPDAITMLCPTWMGLKDSQGNIAAKEDPRISAFAKEHGIKIIPLIWGSDKRTMHNIFSNIFSRTRLVKNIVAALDSFSYCQGVNLDFEGLDPKDRWSFDNFLIELSAKLKPKGYLLTIDVPAKSYDNKWNDYAYWCDYIDIGRTCDIVMIMCYDEHWSTSKPGPVASVQMDHAVLKYATSVMPKEKVFLGLPFYGYDWPQKGRATARRYGSVTKLLEERSGKLMWDREAKVPWYTYTSDEGVPRTLYFENAASISAKLEIARRHDVGGVCIWSLGGEDPAIWDAMREYRKP